MVGYCYIKGQNSRRCPYCKICNKLAPFKLLVSITVNRDLDNFMEKTRKLIKTTNVRTYWLVLLPLIHRPIF